MDKKPRHQMSMADCARVIATIHNYKDHRLLLSSKKLKKVYLDIQEKYYNKNGEITDKRFKTELQYWSEMYAKSKFQPPRWASDMMWNIFKIEL